MKVRPKVMEDVLGTTALGVVGVLLVSLEPVITTTLPMLATSNGKMKVIGAGTVS